MDTDGEREEGRGKQEGEMEERGGGEMEEGKMGGKEKPAENTNYILLNN